MKYDTIKSTSWERFADVHEKNHSVEFSPTVDVLHQDIWKRFVLRAQGLVLDFADPDGTVDLPTKEDCREAKPNALAWMSPIENGPFFTGLYLEGVLRRWKLTGAETDRAKARFLKEGLMLASSVGTEPGFIARGVLSDLKSHYGIGSDDQTAPWFYGLWRYVQSGAATLNEKEQIIAKMTEVARILESRDWQMPCDSVGGLVAGQSRGEWGGPDYRGATRLLFVTRVLYELTEDEYWNSLYREALHCQLADGVSRLQVVEGGMPAEWKTFTELSKCQLWIYVVSQAMVRELYELESDGDTREAYCRSLQVCADAVLPSLSEQLSDEWGSSLFRTDWRVMNKLWKPQTTIRTAVDLAVEQFQFWENQGRELEIRNVREPFCAAWIASLAPDRVSPSVLKSLTLLETVPWSELKSSFGIFAESVYYIVNEAAERIDTV